MIILLKSQYTQSSPDAEALHHYLKQLPNIQISVHEEHGVQQTLTEIYLLGDTRSLDADAIAAYPVVERVIRVQQDYRVLGRHTDNQRSHGFSYNGVEFSQDTFHVFAGLCAVDNPQHVEYMLKAVADSGQVCTRMGAYKPRTNPYSFQGHGADCLPYVFELAGKHGIKVIAMEITHESHIEEINHALAESGQATGVMLQIGTRNTQNFELLKAVGRQRTFPVLLKRGFGITLNESLNAAEYLASEGNSKVIFCLRGVKTNMGDPHRNLVDFAHVPTVKRLTRMPVCVDPSHSVGSHAIAPDGIPELVHASAQGVISGANMILIDFHPNPSKALVDGPQALTLPQLPNFLADMQSVHACYQQRRQRYTPAS